MNEIDYKRKYKELVERQANELLYVAEKNKKLGRVEYAKELIKSLDLKPFELREVIKSYNFDTRDNMPYAVAYSIIAYIKENLEKEIKK